MDLGAFFKSLFAPPAPAVPTLGANFDTRTPEEREAQDVHASETIAAAAPVVWKEIPKDQVRTFGVQDQGGKSDCVAESRRKIKRVLFKVNKGLDIDFSALAFYRKRSNYPAEGMMAADAIALDTNEGMTLEALVPSDVVSTEAAANKIKPDAYNEDVAEIFRISDTDVIFTPGDLDTPAGTIQKTRKAVMMWFYFTSSEWSQEVPTIKSPGLTVQNGLRHSVVGIEPAIYQGKQGIWIDDSAHFGGLSRRFITREFYEKRNWFASYPIAFKFDGISAKPHYNESVISLQECLKYEGIFPSNVDATGTYGPITTAAVKGFQMKYGLEAVGTVGPLTKKKLHELYP